MLSRIFNDDSGNLLGKVTGVGLVLIALNVLAWVWAFVAFHNYPLLMGTALLAYSFGLRHAVDADHIAAIDNVTRKLMQEGKRPVSVGLFFSLGHSTIVVLLSLLVAVTTSALQDRFEDMKAIGGLVGTSVSAFFLFAIAGANLIILVNTWKSFQSVKNGKILADEDLDMLLAGGGLMSRLFRRLFRLIGRSWHMFGLGLLFGLGFDTATEVGLLGISASGASDGLSPWAIMVFPALFSAGMALVDTADGILMLGAYGWAFVKPVRKLYYNLTITSLSVMVAVVVGGIETLGLIGDQFKMEGSFWELVGTVNDNFGLLGYGIIGLFVAGWIVSLVIYKVKGFDEIEATA
ncbi:MAG TPA: HoxN/HupN/NixA family nickel/cobalt transporter [Patescibacteria group bacterium]|nr:HoxN/HupN/NixA family nickel/cobalt transporter [Patescibacteria group bacterium]